MIMLMMTREHVAGSRGLWHEFLRELHDQTSSGGPDPLLYTTLVRLSDGLWTTLVSVMGGM